MDYVGFISLMMVFPLLTLFPLYLQLFGKLDWIFLTLFLQVHFRGYPGNILVPCEGEESIKWSFINSLKEVGWTNCFVLISWCDLLSAYRGILWYVFQDILLMFEYSLNFLGPFLMSFTVCFLMTFAPIVPLCWLLTVAEDLLVGICKTYFTSVLYVWLQLCLLLFWLMFLLYHSFS